MSQEEAFDGGEITLKTGHKVKVTFSCIEDQEEAEETMLRVVKYILNLK